MKRKKERIVLPGIQISGYAAEGKSIARHDGKVIFITGAVPGDTADILLTKNKKDWAEGRAIAITEYSKERSTPFCKHFGTCGGCKWQMLPYKKQLEYKQQEAEQNLRRIGKIDMPEILPIVGADDDKHYRNKLEFTFSNKEFTASPKSPPKEGTSENPENLKPIFGYQTANPILYELLKEFVHKHRNNPTDYEKILWDLLKGKQLDGYKFRRQHIIGEFIADFVCLQEKLIIEVDGKIHDRPDMVLSDVERTEQLNKYGFEVIRFKNEEVLSQHEVVLEKILSRLKEKKSKIFSSTEVPPLEGFREAPALGFHAPRIFDKAINIDECFLMDDVNNTIRNSIREFALANNYTFYDARNHTGWLRNIIIRYCTTGELMVNMVLNYEEETERKKLLDYILQTVPSITTLLYTINTKWNDSIHDLQPQVYFGKGYVMEKLEDFTFKISPKSFFQTNTKQAEKLYSITREFAALTGTETVYDLYCGTGSIGIFVSKGAKKIIGVEVIAEAIEDAKENAALNNITHASFFAGDVIKICDDEFFATHGKPDVVITDPPRAGMHEKLIQKLLEMQAPRIVYVSCNTATQARDIALLAEKYTIEKVQPVDMFPHTHHIESVALLKLKI